MVFLRSEPEPMAKVMLVEDDKKLARVVSDYLVEHGYEIAVERYGDVAVGRIRNENPDAVILDVNLPEMDGFAVCREVRGWYAGAIIMLTARSGDIDEVLGLELGADDYLTKPVRPTVLLARLGLHLRRGTVGRAVAEEIIELTGLTLYPKRRWVELHGKPIELKPAEFDLLLIFAKSPGKVITRAELFGQCNPGERYDFRDRSIDLRVSRLRKKLQEDTMQPNIIQSVRGIGYLLVDAK
jgi:DNA-binding response OmpR family regulator